MTLSANNATITKTRADRLREAAAIIASVVADLDITELEPCGECGRRIFANSEDAKNHEQLRDVPSRLMRIASQIDD